MHSAGLYLNVNALARISLNGKYVNVTHGSLLFHTFVIFLDVSFVEGRALQQKFPRHNGIYNPNMRKGTVASRYLRLYTTWPRNLDLDTPLEVIYSNSADTTHHSFILINLALRGIKDPVL